MNKFAVGLAFLALFFFLPLESAQARQPRRMQYEDSVSESMWDWATTLGKSPQDKKKIKAKRRYQRTKKRVEKKARQRKARIEKENIARDKEAKRIRDSRIKKRGREIQKRESQQGD